MARTALAVSPAIVHGMLAGIGVTIAVAQLHVVLGRHARRAPSSTTSARCPPSWPACDPAAVSMSLLTLALLLAWPRIPGRAGQRSAQRAGRARRRQRRHLTAALAGLVLPKVDLPSWRSHALAGLPEGPVLGVAAAVLTVTLVAAWSRCWRRRRRQAGGRPARTAGRALGVPARIGRSDLDRELLGQGAANVVSGVLGGLPVAGVRHPRFGECRKPVP